MENKKFTELKNQIDYAKSLKCSQNGKLNRFEKPRQYICSTFNLEFYYESCNNNHEKSEEFFQSFRQYLFKAASKHSNLILNEVITLMEKDLSDLKESMDFKGRNE